MTIETMNRRSRTLAAVIGTVLASYAGSAAALEFEFENGGKLNWNTTVSLGSSWRAEDPSRWLYTRADGSLIGEYTPNLVPGTRVGPRDGLAGNHAAGDADLNYASGDQVSMPLKLITDFEYKKGRFGGLLRFKAWTDFALENNKVRVGSQANNYNGVRPGLGPVPGFRPCQSVEESQNWKAAGCMPMSPAGQNLWPEKALSDDGFEDEQKFTNIYLLDAYLYGSFAVGNSDVQVRLGNQVINWGESIFIQGVNQINPVDVPAARRPGAELKEILLPVWAAYLNWGFDWGSVEAFYQLQWNNTSVDACGTYFAATSTQLSSDPGSCGSITVVGAQLGNLAPGTASPYVPQLGSQPWMVGGSGIYVPAVKGREPDDMGQLGISFRVPVDAIDTELGLYAMQIHSRLPVAGSYTGTNPNDLPTPVFNALAAGGYVGNDAYGAYWKVPTSSTLFRSLMPGVEKGIEAALAANGINIDLESGKGFWEYPEDMRIFGLSAATNLFGWSTSAEFSYQENIPVMVNGNDVIAAGVLGIGPYRDVAAQAQAGHAGTYMKGYKQFTKKQFQVNFVKTFGNLIGAESLALIGEAGMQWNNVPDYTEGGVRYGRGFMYGTGSGQGYGPGGSPSGQPALGPASLGNMCSPTFVGAPVPIANTLYNPQPIGCKNDGYVTDFAWGYRVRASADYNNVFNTGVTVTPSVFWLDDVEGVSMDPTFNEGRQQLGLGVKFNLNKKYVFDLNYVNYADKNFDPLFDRDYYSASFSVTF
jgi:hypothetical protein